MRNRYVLLVVLLLSLGFGAGRLSVATEMLDSPSPPGSTFSHTLENVYNRLHDGAAGTQSAFAEPASGPTAGTGHTLDEIMAIAPAVDDTHGATQTHVLAGQTAWGLTSGQWGPITGTMPDNGTLTLTPTTTQQTIAAGYHNGSGYVEGDIDLIAGNIKDGVDIFGVAGTYPTSPVPKTGQTQCYTTTSGSGTSCPAADYPGQDGDYQKGVTWPNPRFITSTAGIVTDTLTGLIWLENANCFGARSWTQALTDTITLNSGECGLTDGSVQGDWRLPNARELYSLVHNGFFTPVAPNTAGTGQWAEGDPFTGIQSSYYWSSTTFAYSTSFAWSVDLNYGYVNGSDKSGTDYVWPVRGGQ